MKLTKQFAWQKIILLGFVLLITTSIWLSNTQSNGVINKTKTPTNLRTSQGDIFFDGMNYSWSGFFNFGPITMDVVEQYSHYNNDIYNVTSTTGWNRDINGTTRLIVNNPGGPWLASSHEWVRIHANIMLGSNVPVSVFALSPPGDQQFTVIDQAMLIRMGRAFDCWVLHSIYGSTAYYDKYSGMCISAKFQMSGMPSNYWYTVNITDTNVPLKPNLYNPALTLSNVSPISGTQTTQFSFNVRYTDLDNDPPFYVNVRINGTAYPMTRINSTDNIFTDGCDYRLITPLQQGNHEYYFECSDGMNTNTTITYLGPTVASINLHGPILTNGVVTPCRGFNATTLFDFTVTYNDADNNAPTSITVTVNGSTHAMMPRDPLDLNYMDGRVYVYSTNLATGTHVFWFNASDETHLVSIGPFYNPIVTAPPYFNGMSINYDLVSQFGSGCWNLTATQLGGMLYNTVCQTNISGLGNRYWNTDFSSREILASNGSLLRFAVGTHDPTWIFTNVSIGTLVTLSTLFPTSLSGEATYVVSGETTYYFPGLGLVDAWILEDPGTGAIALYEKSTGLLLNGTFIVVGFPYTLHIHNTNVPFELLETYITNGNVLPRIGSPSINYNFSIVYVDTNNLAPSSIFVVIDSVPHAMTQAVPSDTDFVDGAVFKYIQNTMPAGNHTCYFIANASGRHLRYPASNDIPAPEVMPYEFSALDDGGLDSNCSDEMHPYRFSVIYQDTQNIIPSWVRVYIDGIQHDMVKDSSDNDFTNGVEYYYTNSSMSPGIHDYHFRASNSSTVFRFPLAGELHGPEVVLRHFGSKYTSSPPSIDGIYNSVEWSGAFTYSRSLGLESAMIAGAIIRNTNFTIYIMNNDTNIYFCITIEGETYNDASSGDFLMIMCDNALNGVLDNCDQVFWICTDPASTYYATHDLYWNTASTPPSPSTDSSDGGTEDGSSVFSHTNPVNYALGTYTFEFSMPFASLDNHDLQLAPGSQFGIKFAFIDYVDRGSMGMPYFHHFGEWLDPSTFGILTLATNDIPHITGGSSVNETSILRNATGYTIDWSIHDDVGGNGTYRVLVNGSPKIGWTPWTDGANLAIPINTNSGFGSFNYTIEYRDYYSVYGVPSHVFVTIFDRPTSTHPLDQVVLQNSTSAVITWKLFTKFSVGSYRVLRDGIQVQSWVPWPGNDTNFNVPVITDFGFGTWNYTIQYNDSMGFLGIPDTVLILVNDIPRITGGSSINNTAIAANSTASFSWTITDVIGGSGSRTLIINGIPGTTGAWISGASIVVNLNTNAGYGTFNYTIVFNDMHGASGIPSQVILLIVHAPRSNRPSDMVILQGTLRTNITWILTDYSGAGKYRVLMNAAIISSWTSWSNKTAINVTVNGSTLLGMYTFTIEFNNTYGIMASDQVKVTIDDSPRCAAVPGAVLTEQNAEGINLSWTLIDGIGAGHFTLYINGLASTTYSNVSWTNNTAFTISVDTHANDGIYNYTLVFWDSNGFRGTQSTVLVTVTKTSNSFLDFITKNWLYLVIGIAGIVVVASVIAASRKKKVVKAKISSKKGNLLPDTAGLRVLGPQTQAPPTKKLSEVYMDLDKKQQQTPVSMPVQQPAITQAQAPMTQTAPITPAAYNFYCARCTKYYDIQNPDLDKWYACPACNEILVYVVYCSRCNNPIALSKVDYDRLKGTEMACPYCQNHLKV